MEFNSLWAITTNYHKLCKEYGAWLVDPKAKLASAALSVDATNKIVSKGYTAYPSSDVWSRVGTWKVPLIQLIATLPRSPLGFIIESLIVLHLVSDPIGSMEDLLYKLEACQRGVVSWERKIEQWDTSANPTLSAKERQQLAKRLAIITESYSELGGILYEDDADELLSNLNL